jgi:predicted phage terminase large subunit-like protein
LKRNSTYAHFRRAIGPNLEPVWPEKWPREALAKRRAEIGEAAFSRGYRLVPIHEGERVIRPEWVQFWNELLNRDQYETVVLSIDPALTAQETADASALVVLARLVGRNEIHVLEARGVRVTTPDLMEQIAQTDRQWQPDVIVFESNAAFAGIRQLLERHAVFGPRVVGVVQSRSKVSRVATLSVPVQNGTVRLRSTGSGVHPSQQELWDEMTLFPFAPHDDLVDALATGVEHLLRSRSPRIWV